MPVRGGGVHTIAYGGKAARNPARNRNSKGQQSARSSRSIIAAAKLVLEQSGIIMRSNTLLACSICLVGLFGCASRAQIEIPTGDVRLGMSADRVSAILGIPSKQSSRANFESWRYEVIIKSRQCNRNTYKCGHVCKYISVWLQNDVVVAMTSRRVDDLSDCGKGIEPVDWQLLPNYAFLCYSSRRRLAEASELCMA